jgi:molybdenum cofactor synthesis domain-containing protein
VKKIPVKNAVGTVLCHDITKIIPGIYKDRAFKKGHIITEEDIPELLSIGKDHIYVWENKEGLLHENKAAQRLAKLAGGKGILFSEVKEGKINFFAEYDGLLKINADKLKEINMQEEIMIATRHNNTPVKKNQKVAGTRIIPLVIEEEKIVNAEKISSDTEIIYIKPFKKHKIGMITTGNEVYYGRIKDGFEPIVNKKVKHYGSKIIKNIVLPDDSRRIADSIKELITEGVDIILCTGGMSVDPDDVTPSAVKKSGAEIISYGAPVLPGAMFLMAYKNNIPIMGLPGCVLYSPSTVFDLILPRVLTGEIIIKEDIASYGHGGLCLECEKCRYPDCPFGKC